MNPRELFPVLAAVFAALAVLSGMRRGHWRGAPLTWGWMALVFAAVAAWLHWGSAAGGQVG